LALLLHELLQLYTKRHRVLNGRACIKLGSTLTVAEVGWRNPFSLLHVVEYLGFLRAILLYMAVLSTFFTCRPRFGRLQIDSLGFSLFHFHLLQPSHERVGLPF